MNFLGASGLSQSRTDLLTAVGQLIDQATSESLLAPDWALNIAVCDAINHDTNDGTTPTTGEQAVRAFRRKLRDSNPKVLQLTLTLLEAAVKNADQPGRDSPFHSLVGTSEFLSNVAALTDGKKGWDVKEQALALLQQWGLSFQLKQSTLAFYSTYMDLRLQGVQFPRLEASSPIFTPPPQSSSSSSSSPFTTTPTREAEASTSAAATAAAAAPIDGAIAELAKLEQDLNQVRERARACLEMLPTSRGIAGGDEALAEVVGFLEACKPRLADVIEAGMEEGGGEEGGEEGVTEGVLELALEVHEEVVQALEAEKAQAMLRQQEGGKEGAAAAAETGRTNDLLEFDQHPPPAQAQRPIPTHPDTTMTGAGGGEGGDHHGGESGESSGVPPAPQDPLDLFGAAPSLAPPAAAAAAAAAVPGTSPVGQDEGSIDSSDPFNVVGASSLASSVPPAPAAPAPASESLPTSSLDALSLGGDEKETPQAK
jgi:hypothetical protein